MYFCGLQKSNGPLAQLNRAFDYGSKGCRFESCRGHKEKAECCAQHSAFFYLFSWKNSFNRAALSSASIPFSTFIFPGNTSTPNSV